MNKRVHRFVSLALAIALALGVSSQALASGASAALMQGNQASALVAAVYYVSNSGSDSNPGTNAAPFKTFTKAVSVLLPGDTLQVMAGTYNQPLVLSRSGTASAPINVIGNGAILNMRSSTHTGIKISGNYISLSNFEVTGATEYGISILGKYVTVKNNVVHDNVTANGTAGRCGGAGSWTSALKVRVGGEHIIIENNTLYENCGEGIAITRGINVLVRNNTVYDNFAPNIYVDNSPFTTVENNLVYCTGAVLRPDGRRPTAIGLGEEEYAGWGAQMHDVLVTGNTVRDCGKGIGAFDSEVGGTLTNVTITRNYIPSGQGRAISMTSSYHRNVVISYNNIFNAVYLQVSTGITLIGNTIIGSGTSPTSTQTATPGSVPTNPGTPTATFTANNTSPTSTQTATPEPAATNPPTSTLAAPVPSNTAAAASTPTSAVSDGIFANGFESGDLSAWSGSATNGAHLGVSPAAALAGSFGMQVQINGTTALYVNDASPNAEPRYRVRFYFDPNSVTLASGDY
ncbi:MAG TPA: right-handed parallel beta-helix repeat-containing protein, partial [Anaerolineales bacterium]|nr:right-handed parallel beta-helix repeat-containing protein [Anaerolineales bacterium]